MSDTETRDDIERNVGGSISDKDITLKSGFIEKLQRDDEVMADRGFNIQEILEVVSKGVKVNVPPFMNEVNLRKVNY